MPDFLSLCALSQIKKKPFKSLSHYLFLLLIYCFDSFLF